MTNAAEGRDWAWRSSDSTQAVGTCKQCFVEHRCAAGASSETGTSEAWAIMVKYMAEMAPSHVAAGGVLTDPSAGGDTIVLARCREPGFVWAQFSGLLLLGLSALAEQVLFHLRS